METMKDYVAHLDNKKRITLRGAAYQYYNVKEYRNGCIILGTSGTGSAREHFSQNSGRYGSCSK